MIFKELLKKYSFPLVVILAIILVVFFLWLFGFLSELSFNGTIENNQEASKTAVTESQNANTNAAVYSQERQTEDIVREKVIKPKLDQARRNSENSKAALEKAQRKYNEKINIENLSSDAVNNCNDLRDQFPDAEFEECDGVPDTRADGSRQSQPE